MLHNAILALSFDVDDVLARLEGVMPAGPGKWRAHCPAHDDHKPSLSIAVNEVGRLLLYCHAGCSYELIMAALKLSRKADRSESESHRPRLPQAQRRTERKPRHIVATYNYFDESGRLVFQKLRYEPKGFAIRRPDGRGDWAWGLGDTEPVLYRLPDLVDKIRTWQPVFVVEGEKDVDLLVSHRLMATCNFDGASANPERSKWRPAYNRFFAGRVVYILPDNDLPGLAHAESIARNLCGVAQCVKIVLLPGLSEKQDVSDWLEM